MLKKFNVKLAASALQDGTARFDVKVTNMRFVRWPPGHVNDWHNAGEVGGRQYVITISGRGEVELADGKRFRSNRDEFCWAKT
jgi:quercetin dioxygenase-like cupin family protein